MSIRYKKGSKIFYAVSDVSFSINEGETVSLVGESGCGKSSIAKAILGISKITTGKIYYKDQIISNHNKKPSKTSQEIQMIFQDPYSSLNPRMTIEEAIKEPLTIYKIGNKEFRNKRVDELLNDVKLPLSYKNRYPHELSGGERQRVSIARALISEPKLLICDEPTHALDCSVQASIINLLKDLKDKLGLSLLFISHDLCLVKNLSDKVLVMYGGQILERGNSEEIFENPLHPFTQKLLSAIPIFGQKSPYTFDLKKETLNTLQDKVEDSFNLNTYIQNLNQSFSNIKAKTSKQTCPYYSSCNKHKSECKDKNLQENNINKNHKCSCHLLD